MLSSLSRISTIFGAFLGVCFAEMRLLKAEDEPGTILQEYEFNVMSFFKSSDPKSVEVDELVEGAMKYLEKKISSGAWSKRNIGWLRVDLDTTPEFALDDSTVTDQAVIGPLKHRMVHFRKVSEDKEDNERRFAEIVRELTGDWIRKIICDEIQG